VRKRWNNEVNTVKNLLDYVSDKGKQLTIHTHVGGFVLQERERIDQFFEMINDDRLLLTFDCAQIAAAEETNLPEIIKIYKDRIFVVWEYFDKYEETLKRCICDAEKKAFRSCQD